MIRLLFHRISLDLSPIFCAIPATNEKIKEVFYVLSQFSFTLYNKILQPKLD